MNITTNNNLITFDKLNKQNIINCFTLKPYNFKDYQNNLIKDEQFDKIFNELNVNIKTIKKPNQTHTNIVKVLDENNLDDSFLNTDGLITNLKNVALVTTLADCQGILLYDKEKEVIGNIHSGWKGTLNRIVENAINLMIETYNCNPMNIQAF